MTTDSIPQTKPYCDHPTCPFPINCRQAHYLEQARKHHRSERGEFDEGLEQDRAYDRAFDLVYEARS